MSGSATFIGRVEGGGFNATSKSFSTVAIGTAAADRKVVFSFSAIANYFLSPAPTMTATFNGGSPVAPDSVAWGGPDGSGNSVVCAIFSADIPTGTTADIVVLFSGSIHAYFDSTLFVYAVNGAGAVIDTASYGGNTQPTAPYDLSVDVENGGVVIAALTYVDDSTPTWVGVSEDSGESLYGSDWRSSASYASSAAETPRTVTVAISNAGGTFLQALLSVSYASGAPSSITGVLSKTLGALTLSSASTLKLVGASSATLSAVTLSSAATLKLQAALAKTLDALALASTGGAGGVTGVLAATLAAATLSAAGTLPLSAQLSKTLDALLLAAAGNLPLNAALAVTLGPATLASTSTIVSPGSGTLGVTLGAATLSSQAAVKIVGQLSAILSLLTLYSVPPQHGRLILRSILRNTLRVILRNT